MIRRGPMEGTLTGSGTHHYRVSTALEQVPWEVTIALWGYQELRGIYHASSPATPGGRDLFTTPRSQVAGRAFTETAAPTHAARAAALVRAGRLSP